MSRRNKACPACGYEFEKPVTRAKACLECGASLVVRRGKLWTERAFIESEIAGFRKFEQKGKGKAIRDIVKTAKSFDTDIMLYSVFPNTPCELCRTFENMGYVVKISDALKFPESIPPFSTCRCNALCATEAVVMPAAVKEALGKTKPKLIKAHEIASRVLSFTMKGDGVEADEKECPFCAEIIKEKAKVCKHCGRDIIEVNTDKSPDATVPPSAPAHVQLHQSLDAPKPKKKRGCLRIGIYTFLALIALSVISQALKSPEQKQKEAAERAERQAIASRETTQRAEAQRKEQERLDAAVPKAEKDLIAAVIAGYQEFQKGGNEIQQERSRDARSRAIVSALGKPEAINWLGSIDSISTNSDGLGILSIKLSSDPEITVSTWNNALSDIMDGTLIQKDSSVYNAMANLKTGDKVIFSGRFIEDDRDSIKESSMTISGSMRAPDFVMVFRNLEKLQ